MTAAKEITAFALVVGPICLLMWGCFHVGKTIIDHDCAIVDQAKTIRELREDQIKLNRTNQNLIEEVRRLRKTTDALELSIK